MPCETAGHSLKRPYHVPVFSHFHPQTSHGSFPSGHGSGPACQKSKSSKFIAQRAFNILRPILWKSCKCKSRNALWVCRTVPQLSKLPTKGRGLFWVCPFPSPHLSLRALHSLQKNYTAWRSSVQNWHGFASQNLQSEAWHLVQCQAARR